ncbi:hypothetical protein E2320_008075 [Naja naja]|nr:hypothetical protein E2320_008075 [Naja naja]
MVTLADFRPGVGRRNVDTVLAWMHLLITVVTSFSNSTTSGYRDFSVIVCWWSKEFPSKCIKMCWLLLANILGMTLFQNSPSQKNDVFHLDIKNVGGIGQILDYMYTSHLDLNQDNIQNLLDIAQCLQVQNILNLCRSFLKTSRSVEQPASLTGNDTFSLRNTSVADTHCGHYDVLHVCSTAAACKALDDRQPESQPCAPHSSSAERAKPKQDSVDPGRADLSFKLPNGHYKLRNFYSKQTLCPSNKGLLEMPPGFVIPPAQDTAQDAALCNISQCPLESSDCPPLAPPFPAQSFNDFPVDQDTETTSVQPAKPLRPKKAIHLQKLNLLRSQKSPEQSSVCDPERAVAKGNELGSQSSKKDDHS